MSAIIIIKHLEARLISSASFSIFLLMAFNQSGRAWDPIEYWMSPPSQWFRLSVTWTSEWDRQLQFTTLHSPHLSFGIHAELPPPACTDEDHNVGDVIYPETFLIEGDCERVVFFGYFGCALSRFCNLQGHYVTEATERGLSQNREKWFYYLAKYTGISSQKTEAMYLCTLDERNTV